MLRAQIERTLCADRCRSTIVAQFDIIKAEKKISTRNYRMFILGGFEYENHSARRLFFARF